MGFEASNFLLENIFNTVWFWAEVIAQVLPKTNKQKNPTISWEAWSWLMAHLVHKAGRTLWKAILENQYSLEAQWRKLNIFSYKSFIGNFDF